MPEILFEKSSAKITATFKDFNLDLFTPKTLFYGMYKSGGKEVIARTEITSGLDTTYTWVFGGSQFDLSDPRDDGKRFLVLDGTFDALEQNDVEFVAQYEFPKIINAFNK